MTMQYGTAFSTYIAITTVVLCCVVQYSRCSCSYRHCFNALLILLTGMMLMLLLSLLVVVLLLLLACLCVSSSTPWQSALSFHTQMV